MASVQTKRLSELRCRLLLGDDALAERLPRNGPRFAADVLPREGDLA